MDVTNEEDVDFAEIAGCGQVGRVMCLRGCGIEFFYGRGRVVVSTRGD